MTNTRERAPKSASWLTCALLPLAIAPLLFVSAQTASAETAWIRGGLRLNLRSEGGKQYRIIGALKTGDAVETLEKGDGWLKVEAESGLKGWIPEGYLENVPPPAIRLQRAEDEAASLGARLESSDAMISSLTSRNEELSSKDGAQRGTIERLTAETVELRAQRRWPEWITGASVLAVGMVLGAILHRSSTRRPQARLRL